MTETEFWAIVERSKTDSNGDSEKQEVNLERELHKLTPEQLVDFDQWFTMFIRAAYRWDLWDAASIITDSCSDDGFWDFRSWVVAQGEHAYKAVLRDPEMLEDVVDKRGWFKFLNRAMFVWCEKLGKGEEGLDDFPMTLGSNLGEEPEGVPCTGSDEIKARFPRLWRKFGGE